MKILAHRGAWTDSREQNTPEAFRRSLISGFGIETDIRDLSEQLVISHNPAPEGSLLFKDFLKHANNLLIEDLPPFALNIKSDGLAFLLANEIQKFTNFPYFCFDMSVPDMKSYIEYGLPVFTRMSEVEEPIWLDESEGVWLDSLKYDWFEADLLKNLIFSGKKVAVVSPELHNRNPEYLWNLLLPLRDEQNLMICTDFPDKAAKFFRGGNR